jgi:hypothetical protein
VDLWLDHRSDLLRVEAPTVGARSWEKPTARPR